MRMHWKCAAAVAVALGCGVALDEAYAAPRKCEDPIVGCNQIPCQLLPGNCQNGAPYQYIFQQGFLYTPCGTTGSVSCPTPVIPVYGICWSAGYNPDASSACATVACGVWWTDQGCPP